MLRLEYMNFALNLKCKNQEGCEGTVRRRGREMQNLVPRFKIMCSNEQIQPFFFFLHMEMCAPKALGGERPVCFGCVFTFTSTACMKESIKHSCNLEHASLKTCWSLMFSHLGWRHRGCKGLVPNWPQVSGKA